MTIRRLASWCACLSIVSTSYLVVGPHFSGSSSATEVQAASVSTFTFTNEPTDRSPESYQGSFLYITVDAMLAAQQVRVYPEDKVYAFPEPGLGLGSHIKIYRAQPVLVKDGLAENLVRTWSKTVGEVLAEQGIEVGEKDVVEPGKDQIIPVGGNTPVITITRVAESQVTTQESIAYKTQYQDDATLEKGATKKQQAGKNGLLEKVYLVHKENGQEVSRKFLSQQVVQTPVDEIIVRGTKVVDYGSGQASWYGGVGSLTAAHRTLPLGTKVRVVNVATGASVIVTIADRGPFVAGRVIDLSQDAFSQIASTGKGVANVRLEKVY